MDPLSVPFVQALQGALERSSTERVSYAMARRVALHLDDILHSRNGPSCRELDRQITEASTAEIEQALGYDNVIKLALPDRRITAKG